MRCISRILGEDDDDDDEYGFFDPGEVYFSIKDGIDAPTPELESMIAQDGVYSYLYAKNILKARFKQGEPAIIKDSNNPWLLKELTWWNAKRNLADEYANFLSTVSTQDYLDFTISNDRSLNFGVE